MLYRQFFPNEDHIGKRIDIGWGNPRFSEIVGVVCDTKQETLAEIVHPTFYAAVVQKSELMKFLSFNLVARTEQDPLTLGHAISNEIHQLDKNQVLALTSPLAHVAA